jgi:hypothetical protein
MKKALTRTIIVFVAVNLMTAGFAFAQDVPEENVKEAKKEALKQAEAARREATIPLDLARKEVDAARKQMEAAQKQMEATRQAITGHEMHEWMETPVAPRVSIPLWQHSGSGAVLVIPAAEMKVENLATITEDMSVMSRIFGKKLSQARLTTRGIWSIGFDSLAALGRSSGAIEAIYLEGYGALFLMKVNVLLSPPPETQQEKETKEEDTDPLWTETIQEMYAPQDTRRRRTDDRPEEKYDAEKVEDLKETLIKTLKHAANIRALKPDQWAILTVIGQSGRPGETIGHAGQNCRACHALTEKVNYKSSPSRMGSCLPTVLTICAKKSDIDAFAKGQLSFDQFRERTKIFTSYKLGSGGFPGVENRPVAQAQFPVL